MNRDRRGRLASCVALILITLCVLAFSALADRVVTPMAGETTNRTAFVDGEGWLSADVTVWSPSGSTDGTVTIYAVPYQGGPRVQVGQYATPTGAAKTFSGRPNGGIEITFTGRTTGDVSVVVRLKR